MEEERSAEEQVVKAAYTKDHTLPLLSANSWNIWKSSCALCQAPSRGSPSRGLYMLKRQEGWIQVSTLVLKQMCITLAQRVTPWVF